MLRREWLVTISLTMLPGCFHSRSNELPPGVLGDLTRAVREDRPAPSPVSSPYDARAVAPSGKDEAPVSPVMRVKHTEQSVPTPPEPLALDPLPPTAPALPMLTVSPPPPETQFPATPPPTASPGDPLEEALHFYREKRFPEAGERLKDFEPGRRELLSALLPLVARLAEKPENGTHLADCTPLLATIEEAIQAIRVRSVLSLDKVCFCRGIERFGMFDPLPPGYVFQAGVEKRPGERVHLYAELKNFICRRSEAAYETSLGCTLVLRDGKNRIVWRQDVPVQVERSRSPRRDCYLGCDFYVPPSLPVGDYYLAVQVSDLTGFNPDAVPAYRTASRSLEFHVGIQGGR